MTSHGNHGSYFTIIAYARGFVNLFAGDPQLFGSFFRDPIAFLRKIRYNGNMFRIWAKIFQDERIVKQTVYERDENFSYADFFRYLSEICDALDIPTPVLLKTHLFNYAKFRHVVFRPRDFVESVPFEKFMLENISM